MKSLVAAVFAVSLAGCAQDFVPKPNDLSVKDFTPPGDDLTVGGGDDGGDDMAAADMAMPDLAMPDLRPPADLTPVCNLSTGDASTVPALYLAGIVTGNSLSTTNFVESAGWSTESIYGAHPVVDVTLGLYAGNPLLIARENDTGNTLSYSTASGCSWGTLQAIYSGAATSNRPSLAGADLIFRGKADNHLYSSIFDGSSWSSGTQLALLTDQWPTAVVQSGVVHAIHTGTDTKVYDAPVGSAGTQAGNATSAQGPTAVVTSDGTLYVVFTGTDTNLYWTKRASGSTTWAAPAQLCAGLGGTCLDTSDKQPLAAVRADGKPIAVWHGTNNKLYTSTLSDGTTPPWSAAIEATGSGETTTFLPAISTGIGAAQAEIVYVTTTGGAHHTRLTGVWSTPSPIGIATYIATPALVSSN
jgi:hypothetical protein